MHHEEELPFSLGAKLAGLLGLWLLTTLWLGAGCLLAGTLCLYLGLWGTPALLLPPLLWAGLMREGVPIALGRAAQRHRGWVAASYVGFAGSQLVGFGWLVAQALGEAMAGLQF